MICPNCREYVSHKQRPGRRCSLCRSDFALEPKENSLNLHDTRVRRLGDKLRYWVAGLRYTEAQLWYAVVRNRVPDPGDRYHSLGCLGLIILFICVWLIALSDDALASALTTYLPGVAVALLLLSVMRALQRHARQTRTRRVPMSFEEFHTSVVQQWSMVYGAPPRGMVEARHVPLPNGEWARTALVCQDLAVLACLAANGAAAEHHMALVHADRAPNPSRPDDWSHGVPPDIPVIVLHDASPAGLDFAAGVRAAYGPRTVNAGLLPRTVLANASALRLRETALAQVQVERRRSSWAAMGLSADEAEWLAGGWWSPLAAVPPRKLLTAVAGAAERARERSEELSDPELLQARRTGFLTWPTAGTAGTT